MTDVHAGARAGGPVPPPGRYGRRGRRRTPRYAVPLVVTLAVVAGVVLAVSAYRTLRPGISGTVTAFTTALDHVDIRFVVARDRPDRPGTCTVRARSRQGEEVGRAEVPVTPGEDPVRVDYRLFTTARPVTGEVVGCRYTDSG